MRMAFTRLLGDVWALDVETPSRQEASPQRDSRFLEQISSYLTLLERQAAKIGCVRVTLHGIPLTPPSPFLDTICAFLRGRAFAVDDEHLQAFIVVAGNVADR